MDWFTRGFQLALILLLLGIAGSHFKQAFSADIPVGWATLLGPLLGALVGGAAIAWQTGQGLKNIRLSQAEQSREDREARIHEAELQRDLERERNLQDAKVLSEALWAELSAADELLMNETSRLRQIKFDSSEIGFVSKHFENRIHKNLRQIVEPDIKCVVYQANAAKIGLLDPGLASRVVGVYAQLLSINNKSYEVSHENSVDEVCSAMISRYEKLSQDIQLVRQSLRIFANPESNKAGAIQTRVKNAGKSKL